jgi:hypothetical protein
MWWFRAYRVRLKVTSLALLALVAQALLLSQHSAAAVARGAEQNLRGAELGRLGLTLADIACFTAVADRSQIDPAAGHEPAPHKPCPVCTLHDAGIVALLPATSVFAARLRTQTAFHRSFTVVNPVPSGLRPPVRAPPIGL